MCHLFIGYKMTHVIVWTCIYHSAWNYTYMSSFLCVAFGFLISTCTNSFLCGVDMCYNLQLLLRLCFWYLQLGWIYLHLRSKRDAIKSTKKTKTEITYNTRFTWKTPAWGKTMESQRKLSLSGKPHQR